MLYFSEPIPEQVTAVGIPLFAALQRATEVGVSTDTFYVCCEDYQALWDACLLAVKWKTFPQYRFRLYRERSAYDGRETCGVTFYRD